ncbi:DUF3833 domain-containing protein [Pseudohaliea rubra]|uniref:Putative lipoprotein n=1 Tax=Pseudohaliea rubra DSM 19751 TaxID=1265313 RepID=A0A095VSB0_9GAMM|nr:DUF3833 domain-containing protein [Pseudohaliea rubra]KGE04250.1 putative lipoprotein precursor [Pseudohaliea rubra DSM 19751]
MRFTLAGLLLTLGLLLQGCSGVSVENYAGEAPALVPERFFNGDLVAYGILKNRSGEVTRRFRAAIKAYWEDGIGTLEEDFVFDDGETDRRVWTLTPSGPDRYQGTAGDVVGEADLAVAGNAMFLDYVLRVPRGDGTIDVLIDDRMYLVDEHTLINESELRKFGLRVGELTLVIRRLGEADGW